MIRSALLACLPFVVLPSALSGQEWSPADRTPTDRSIELAVVVEASPEQLFRMWTTREGVRRFMSVDAVIDPVEGGSYEIYFVPLDHPDARANSTEGARLLHADPGRMLAFEWGTSPLAPELDARPSPLWVEVRFTPLETATRRTVVRLSAHGFGRGPVWDRVYEFDVRGWGEILYALDRAAVDPSFRPAWAAGESPAG